MMNPFSCVDATAAPDDTTLYDGLKKGRKWRWYLRRVSQKVGLGTAMMGTGFGLTGLGGAEQKQADAGIITSASADPQILAFGATYAVKNGGSVGYITNSAGHGSGVYLGNGWVLTAGHVANYGGALTFGTGTNFNSDPGTIHSPSQVIFHPQYSNLGNHDLALIKYPTLNQSSILTIATSRPATGSDIWLAGYGTTGTPAGYTIQDGFIRAGTSGLYYGPVLDTSGYSNVFYGLGDMRSFIRPYDIRAYVGDSGGGVLTPAGELLGIMIAAGNSPSNPRTYFLDGTNLENSSWIQSITAVPEPTSLFLVGAAGLATFGFRRVRRPKENRLLAS